MAYPNTIDSFTTKSSGQTIQPADVNGLQTSIVATQTELGTDPAGAFVDVATRLDQIEGGTDRTFKNHIINGGFDIWQRATSQTSSGYGSDDRWINGNGGTTKVHSQQAFTIGQTAVPNNPKYYSRTVVTSVAGAGNYCSKTQKIEDVTKSSGQTVTVSFWAKADSNKSIATEFIQVFGTGGSPSSAVLSLGVTTHNLTTSWQQFTMSVTLPSVSGKTLGSNGDDNYQFAFWYDAGSTYNARTNSLGQQSGIFDIANVQLETGSVATDFEVLPIESTLIRCQRYFEVIDINNQSYHGQFGSSGPDTFYGHPVTMQEKRISNSTVTHLGAASSWVIVGVNIYSAASVTGITFLTTKNTVKMDHVRQVGGAAPTLGNLYLYEGSFSMLVDAEL